MRASFRLRLLAGVMTLLSLGPALGALDAREWAGADAAALRELLEGSAGRREAWAGTPELVVVSSVLRYGGTDLMAEHVATGVVLSSEELRQIADDLTGALDFLTGGRTTGFSNVRTEVVAAGEAVKLLRRGQIVVARFDGFRAKSGTLGYGGRMTRQGMIAAGAVMLDADFDRQLKGRRLLRTHELGHALGFNHVHSRRSFMNPQVGADVTEFDRQAVEAAYRELPIPASVQAAR